MDTLLTELKVEMNESMDQLQHLVQISCKDLKRDVQALAQCGKGAQMEQAASMEAVKGDTMVCMRTLLRVEDMLKSMMQNAMETFNMTNTYDSRSRVMCEKIKLLHESFKSLHVEVNGLEELTSNGFAVVTEVQETCADRLMRKDVAEKGDKKDDDDEEGMTCHKGEHFLGMTCHKGGALPRRQACSL